LGFGGVQKFTTLDCWSEEARLRKVQTHRSHVRDARMEKKIEKKKLKKTSRNQDPSAVYQK